MVAKGKGILMAPRWATAHYLVSAELEPQVLVCQNKDMAVYPLYQKQRYLMPKVIVVVDF